jgi:hypothetical protein
MGLEGGEHRALSGDSACGRAGELLEKGSKLIVLSRGMQLMLQTCPETLQLLKEQGIGVHVEQTRRAAEPYNKLAESEPVSGLFHSTC